MTELPEEFRKRMTALLGSEYPDFLASYNRPRQLSLRVNTLKADEQSIRKLLPYLEENVPWEKSGIYFAEYEDDAHRPGKSPLHEAGCYYIQEASAMAVAALSGVQKGERVLDLCAAPGGKSTGLAARMQGEGLLVSNEIHPQRAKILSQNIERCGIRNAIVTSMDPKDLAEHFPAFFDRIVVDAPCSGEGMFRKEQAALDMWSVQNILDCHARQMTILESAEKMLRFGGTLIYSTCTFAPEEDEQTIAAFLEAHPDYRAVDLPDRLGPRMEEFGFETGRPAWCGDGVLENTRLQLQKAIRLFPHRLQGEGHFLAILTKGEPTPSPVRSPRAASGSGKGKKDPGQEAFRAFLDFAAENLRDGFSLSGTPVLFGQELYLMPEEVSLRGLKVLRPGLDLGMQKKGRFEPSHALALSIRKEDALRSVDFASDSREAAAYLRGESLPCDPARKGWVLVTFSGYSAGWAKAAGGMLKNHYPKGLRRPY